MGCFIGFRGFNFFSRKWRDFESSAKLLSFKGALIAHSRFADLGDPRRYRILAVFSVQGTMFGKFIGAWDGKA